MQWDVGKFPSLNYFKQLLLIYVYDLPYKAKMPSLQIHNAATVPLLLPTRSYPLNTFNWESLQVMR